MKPRFIAIESLSPQVQLEIERKNGFRIDCVEADLKSGRAYVLAAEFRDWQRTHGRSAYSAHNTRVTP